MIGGDQFLLVSPARRPVGKRGRGRNRLPKEVASSNSTLMVVLGRWKNRPSERVEVNLMSAAELQHEWKTRTTILRKQSSSSMNDEATRKTAPYFGTDDADYDADLNDSEYDETEFHFDSRL